MKRKISQLTKLKIIVLMTFVLGLIPFAIAEEGYHHVLTLESPDPENHAWYGYKVKICGDIIVVTEPYANVEDIADAGKVYLYDLEGNLLSTLQSPTPGDIDQFGDRFDIHEKTIIIQEPGCYVNELNYAGRAHVFTTDGTHKYTLESPKPRRGGYYGTPGIYEDIIAVYENRDEGIVYLYNKEGELLKNLSSPEPIVMGGFGRIIEISETLILIGENGFSMTPRGQGTVYIFNHVGEHLMTIKSPMPEEQAMFGTSISISDNMIVIGESYATVNETFRAGRAYIYNTKEEHLHTLESPNPKTNGQFGDSVAIDGDRIVIGEWGANVNPGLYEGRAYVFDVNGILLDNLIALSPCPRAAFGLDVDIEGNIVVVGECWAAIEGFSQAGRVQVYRFGEEPVIPEVGETPTVTETEVNTTDYPSGGIPSFPIIAIIFGLIITSIMLRNEKNNNIIIKISKVATEELNDTSIIR